MLQDREFPGLVVASFKNNRCVKPYWISLVSVIVALESKRMKSAKLFTPVT